MLCLTKLTKPSNLLCKQSIVPWIKMNEAIEKRHIFTQKYNPLTGTMEWSFVAVDYDYIQEISRSDYGDMLWDRERNQLYNKAIRKYVRRLLKTHSSPDQRIKVLDIGTGTGLLSMMVCREFGSQIGQVDVTAYECFKPMAECAQQVIKTNGYHEKIKVINKRSDEAEPSDEERADLLVTEVFDTELIGEGALGVFNHALTNQLKPNPLIVPHKARIWVQLVKSPWLNRGHQFVTNPLKVNSHQTNNDTKIVIPDKVINCYGSNQLHDLQASQLIVGKDIDLLSEPKIAFTFDFTDASTLKYKDEQSIDFTLKQKLDQENVNILFWWDLFMDDEEEYLLSCAPYWAHPIYSKDDLPWRDHWMQAIYYLPAHLKPFSMDAGDVFRLRCFHDEFSFWFDIASSDKSVPGNQNFCKCGIHVNLSRNRIRMMTNEKRLQQIVQPIISKIQSKPNLKILFIGDASLLPIILAKNLTDSCEIFCIRKGQPVNSLFLEEFGEANRVSDKISIKETIFEIKDTVFDVVVSEPYFNPVNLPWDTLHFWYVLSELKDKNMISQEALIYPIKGRLKALPVSFDNLWEIKAKLGDDVEGFDLTDFDKLIESAKTLSDTVIEPQPLWEYPCLSLAQEPLTIFEWDFAEDKISLSSKFSQRKVINLDISAGNNNISMAFWMEFDFDEETISTGPVSEIRMNEKVDWCKDWKQGTAFLYTKLKPDNFPTKPQISIEVTYQANTGLMDLKYDLVET